MMRTTIYIDRKLVDMMHMEVDNVSELVRTLLERYLSTNSLEDIDRKIGELEENIMVLKKRREDMIAAGMSEERTDEMNKNILKEMQDIYIKRREQIGDNKFADEQWITAPKNIQKCKIIGKEPLVFLEELREWYDKQNKKRTGKNGDILSIGHS